MESTVVIKVKYGDTLRRFHARVNENNQLDLDMVGLRAKILSLFNFSADENFILRYVDEDGDLVTLVDDDDLHDMMRQRLKFLRIDVHVSNDSAGISNAWSSGSATPLTSFTPKPFLREYVAVAPNALKSVPEVLRDAVSKLAVDLVANLAPGGELNALSRASAAPLTSTAAPDPFMRDKVTIYADALKSAEQLQVAVSKLLPDLASIAKSGAKSNAESRGNATPFSLSPIHDQNVAIYADALKSAEQLQEAVSKLSLELASVATSDGKSNISGSDAIPLRSSPALKVGVAADALKSVPEALRESKSSSNNLVSHLPSSSPDIISKTVQPTPNSLDQTPNAAGPSSKNVLEESVTSEVIGPILQVRGSTFHASQQLDTGNVTNGVVGGVAPVDLNVLPCDPFLSQSTNLNSAPFSLAVPEGDSKKGKMCADNNFACKGEIGGASFSSAVPNSSSTHTTTRSTSASVECPFSGTYTYGLRQPDSGKHGLYPFKRSHSHTEATSGMFHKGVRCDGCGVYPITGPRFKSKVKDNYDLCSICFNEMGNETDYIKMDRPMSVGGPKCFKGVYEHPPWMGVQILPPIIKASTFSKHAKPKLDSRFILDVNIIDGTMMAPSTAFTKIWRMRNNGTLVWPKGTELVWIGGDKFSDSYSVYIEVPEDGVPMDKELDIAVDFRAPQVPGRYVSYWRLASPSGQKFGQRVWVLIQVDASLKDSFYDSSHGLNWNITFDVNGSNGPQILDIKKPIEDNSFLQHLNPNAPTEPVVQMSDEQPMLKLENEIPVVNEAACVHPATSPPAAASVAPLEVTAGAVPTHQQSSAVDAPSSSLGIGGNNSVEETLLKELEDMGFKEVDLNKEILRMNEYNLEQSVDDLCGVSEWDPILEELREMGFRDNEMNMRLLKKNNGSIKRVVMDLINGE